MAPSNSDSDRLEIDVSRETGSKGRNPFRLPLKNKWLAGTLERVLGLDPLARCYDERPKALEDKLQTSKAFLAHTLSFLGANLQLENPKQFLQLPKQEAALVISNHPLGGLEGVALTRALLEVRDDVKVLTNKVLTRIPELSNLFIGVDVLSKSAAKDNARGIREACKHLANGGVLLVFPAGMVSAININGLNIKRWNIADRTWNTLVGRLAKKYQAPCLPLFVDGRNSWLFYIMGLIHRRLRTVMLARELANKSGKTIPVRAGEIITTQEINKLDGDVAVTHYFRIATDLLEKPATASKKTTSIECSEPLDTDVQCRDEILSELYGLGDHLIFSQNQFAVYCAPYAKLGSIMREIARAREVTFRAVGEGTGKALDSDCFDPHYDHLFIWDKDARKIVGGYRLGRADEIVAEHGLRGLYSRSLYYFNLNYLKKMGSAIEVGRSFVVPEYQRHPRALDLLWRGIGAYMVAHPNYHTLFGCVSISKEHSELARAFLSDSMLEGFRAEQKYLDEVTPVAPLKVKGKLWTAEILASLADIAVINKLLGRFDAGKTVPILLRQYLNLNGRFICFTLNKGFNNSLDGLILVDLRRTSEKYLRRYLGKDGCADFLSRWNIDNDRKLNQEYRKQNKERHEAAA